MCSIVSIFYFLACVYLSSALLPFEKYDKLNLKFYNGYNSKIYHQYYMSNITQLLTHKSFDKDRPTAMYVFGWTQSPVGDTTRQLIDAYIARADHNFLVLDWSDYSLDFYGVVSLRVTTMSRIYARSLVKLFSKGMSDKMFHCIGHSFGAHICGILGREVQALSKRKYKFGRITGLDPAKRISPLGDTPLSTKDAHFVDTIQSDTFFVGAVAPLGHVSFYPNGGKLQPGCPPIVLKNFLDFTNLWCSHYGAIRYYTETVKPESTFMFPSQKCSNWKNFKNRNCETNDINYMGINASSENPGVYYNEIRTNGFYDGIEFYYYVLGRIGQRVFENLVKLDFAFLKV